MAWATVECLEAVQRISALDLEAGRRVKRCKEQTRKMGPTKEGSVNARGQETGFAGALSGLSFVQEKEQQPEMLEEDRVCGTYINIQ